VLVYGLLFLQKPLVSCKRQAAFAIGKVKQVSYNRFILADEAIMQKVLVTVVGIQTDEQGEQSRIELVSMGTSQAKEDVLYCTYQESPANGMEGTTTLLKVYAEGFILVRRGAVEQKQEFFLNKKSSGNYGTPFGTMAISVFTKKVTINRGASISQVEAIYELEVNGRWQSTNTLSVSIQEER
jgi:uncharacterized beta-barrel protein YwiB (DUF1934 family)